MMHFPNRILAVLLLVLAPAPAVGAKPFHLPGWSVTAPRVVAVKTTLPSKRSLLATHPVFPRGGAKTKEVAASPSPACGDSDIIIGLKTLANAALQTAGLLGVFKLGELGSPRLNNVLSKLKIPASIFGLPLLQWVSSFFVIFSSSTVKSLIDGGMGAATSQVLKPSVVPGDGDWYTNLKKPWFNPPGWVFPIMWLIVSKPTQLLAIRKMLQQSSIPYWPALTVYCAHLSLGDAWNEVFFGCQRVGLGATVISTFFGTLLASTKLIANVDEASGKLMLPTCGWVFVATSLNLSIYRLNQKEE